MTMRRRHVMKTRSNQRCSLNPKCLDKTLNYHAGDAMHIQHNCILQTGVSYSRYLVCGETLIRGNGAKCLDQRGLDDIGVQFALTLLHSQHFLCHQLTLGNVVSA